MTGWLSASLLLAPLGYAWSESLRSRAPALGSEASSARRYRRAAPVLRLFRPRLREPLARVFLAPASGRYVPVAAPSGSHRALGGLRKSLRVDIGALARARNSVVAGRADSERRKTSTSG
jgi:hypothetical protein